ncbi:CaiB/BaiF CoA transferase family protein [Nesterenkonia ebinurensis]|uniref:CaiB/BaiF CoA transferase family protein n=1 Tax=Nesterenkonia ebinurensis TaxID=2608252 RepID=UPI00123CBD8F|nr:CoA transferase [Nesterenkonia ebinurensis]
MTISEVTGSDTTLLSGLRVLDMSTMIAAPLTASQLADFGADVVKVERPQTGDLVRKFGTQKDGEGLYWKTLSRNKRSVAVDLHFAESQELIRNIIKDFDVLIENYRPGTLEKWGMAPDVLRRINPRLIVLRMTAYGQDGPYKDRPGFGTLAEAMTGLAAVSGYADRPPLLPAYPLADILAGHLGTGAILAAAYRRERSGRGECIDLAIYEAALKLLDLNIVEYDQKGTEHPRLGNRMSATAPRGAYKCRDGMWIALSGSAQPIAERVLRAIGGEDLVQDPRFRTNEDRVKNVEELDDLINAWCLRRDRDDAIEELSTTGCAVGPLETVASMFENPQVVARESVTRIQEAPGRSVAMTNIFPRFAEADLKLKSVGPSRVGTHTYEFLRKDMGLQEDDIARLRDLGAVQID